MPNYADLKTQYKAEVFCGVYYWLLCASIPGNFNHEEQPSNADCYFARSSFDECAEYICELMDEAAADLPVHWQNNTGWFGKPNKIVCAAVKSIVLTHAASPQWNGNSEYADFKNPDGTPLANTVYDENKWRKAAEASKVVITIAENEPAANLRLYKNNEQEGGTFNPYKSLVDVQIKPWNCEVIFGRYGDYHTEAWMIHTSPT